MNPIVLEVITLYAVFLENISNMGLHYVLFNKNDEENSAKLIAWMQSFVCYAYGQHAQLEYLPAEEIWRKYCEN